MMPYSMKFAKKSEDLNKISKKFLMYISVAAGGFSTRRCGPKKSSSFFWNFILIFAFFCKFHRIWHHFRNFSNLTLEFFKIYFSTFTPNGYCFVCVRTGVRNYSCDFNSAVSEMEIDNFLKWISLFCKKILNFS